MTTIDEHKSEREELLRLKDIAERAMSEDITLLKAHVADAFSIVTFSGRQFDNFEVFVREWNLSRERYLQGGTFEVVIEPTPAMFFDQLAVCRGDSTNVLRRGNGKEFRFSSPWTAVFIKEGGHWKILRAHSSIDPFQNSIVRDGAMRFAVYVAIASLVVGIGIGLFAGMISR